MTARSPLWGGAVGLALLAAVLILRSPPAPGPDPDTGDAEESALPVPPVPPRIADGPDYEHCLTLLRTDPQGADNYAQAWQATGGGDGARQCEALAEIGLGNPEAGAEALESLAGRTHAQAASRATIYGQAAQAWMMANDPSRAYSATTMALSLTPDDADLLIDRSIAAALLNRFQDSIADLDRAWALDPHRTEILVYRSGAERHLNQLQRARDDIEAALQADPQNAEALLEQGILLQRSGDRDGARSAWQRAAKLAPGSATADLANQNLALLDAGPERPKP